MGASLTDTVSVQMPVLVRSGLLAAQASIAHGFTTRVAGESPLAGSLGMDPALPREQVLENRRLVLAALGQTHSAWISLRQVHGDSIVQVTGDAGASIEADGVWTRDQGVTLAILTADCVPILLTDRAGSFVAAVHAGWRGTKAKIAARMVERLATQGIAAKDMLVAIGPAIGPCCFAIGEDVAQSLAQAFPASPEAIVRNEEGYVADLWALNRTALEEAGVPGTAIDELRLCTVCDPRFFSHRRDHAITGRQAGVIALRASPAANRDASRHRPQ